MGLVFAAETRHLLENNSLVRCPLGSCTAPFDGELFFNARIGRKCEIGPGFRFYRALALATFGKKLLLHFVFP